MSAFPSIVKTSSGRIFHLTKEIGKGGEGAIFETNDQHDVALKLYWPNKAQSRREKVSAMASAQWYKTNSFVTFPIDVLFSAGGAFVGFAMKKVGGHKPVHMLYSPASRKLEFQKANYKFLILAAANIARAVASVDATGCVIGDVNHSGFLVSDKATSIVIDSDLFQVVAGNHSFLCQVGTPEYTPPELQGGRWDRIKRTANHDNFGLAVLIFQLLFLGRHPFSGKFLGSGEMPLERAIGEYRFAYSMQSANKMERPPGAPMLSDFPSYIGEAFEQAFGQSGPQSRPTASVWINLLEQLGQELEQCKLDSNHQHVKGKPCPWCRMEKANPGFVAFSSTQASTYIPTIIDVAQISSIINAIRDPGPAQNLQTVINAITLAAAAPSSALISKLKNRAYAGTLASGLGTIAIFFGGEAVYVGVVTLVGGLICNVIVPPELKKLRETRSQASAGWRSVENAWSQQAGNQRFLEIKRETNEFIRALSDLPNEERRGIQFLEQKKREIQLNRHLDRFLIAHAKIRKIGSGRKAVLASFGIETAADIVASKISTIQGFGPSLVAELMAWRKIQENKFVFNPSEPINQTDLLTLKNKIASRQIDLANKIRASAIKLEQESRSALEQRTKIAAAANQAWIVLKQAELNEAAATGPIHKASKFISLCCAGLAAVGLMMGKESFRQTTNTNRSVVLNGPTEQPSPPPRPNVRPSNPDSPQSGPGTSNAPRKPGGPSANANPTPNVPQSPAWKPVVPQYPPPLTGLPQQSAPQSPPLEAPKEVPSIPEPNPAPPSVPKLDLARTEDVIRIQQRLIDLGYLAGSADGKWGPRSKAALIEFKSRASLPGTDVWDDAAQSALFSDTAKAYALGSYSSDFAFVGGWTNEIGACGTPGELPPLRITATRAETDGGACEFKSVRPDGQNAWRVSAVCSSGGKSWQANVRLTLNGSKLRWVSERPETIYYRCSS